MTHYEVLLAAATIAGFALLLLTVGAFVVSRARLGLVTLVAAGAAFVAALTFMGHVSAEQEQALRSAVNAKYDVHIQKWGEPLGTSPLWQVDGKSMDCEADVSDESDPVVKCDGHQLPLR